MPKGQLRNGSGSLLSLRMDQYWQVNEPAYVKVPKPGRLKRGYHGVAIEFGWVNNYNTATEKEYDGRGLATMGPTSSMGGTGVAPHRRLLLVWQEPRVFFRGEDNVFPLPPC